MRSVRMMIHAATPRSRRAVTAVLIALLASILEVPVWCAGPPLTPQQIQDAIAEGKQYKTAETLLACLDHEYSSSPHVQWNHLCNGVLPGKRIKLKWLSQYAMFFNDFVAVAAQSAAANQQMRELRPTEVESHGLLHVLVTEHGRGRKVAKSLGGHLKTGQLGSPQNRPVRRPSSRTRISFTLSVAVLASLSASVVPGSSLPLPASGGEL